MGWKAEPAAYSLRSAPVGPSLGWPLLGFAPPGFSFGFAPSASFPLLCVALGCWPRIHQPCRPSALPGASAPLPHAHVHLGPALPGAHRLLLPLGICSGFSSTSPFPGGSGQRRLVWSFSPYAGSGETLGPCCCPGSFHPSLGFWQVSGQEPVVIRFPFSVHTFPSLLSHPAEEGLPPQGPGFGSGTTWGQWTLSGLPPLTSSTGSAASGALAQSQVDLLSICRG